MALRKILILRSRRSGRLEGRTTAIQLLFIRSEALSPWLLGCALLATLAGSAVAQTRVDVALVLAVDVSLSIDNEEFALQRQGYAAAFRNPRVVDAITLDGAGTMAVTYVQWSGAREQQQIIGWRLIHDAASAASFADELAAADRLVASG